MSSFLSCHIPLNLKDLDNFPSKTIQLEYVLMTLKWAVQWLIHLKLQIVINRAFPLSFSMPFTRKIRVNQISLSSFANYRSVVICLEIRRRTGEENIIVKQKWRWACHVARIKDGRMTKEVLEWIQTTLKGGGLCAAEDRKKGCCRITMLSKYDEKAQNLLCSSISTLSRLITSFSLLIKLIILI